MYAAMVSLTIDLKQAQAAAAAFTNDILPRVKSAPGFISGYWLDPANGEGFGFVLFETEEEARRSVPLLSRSAPGVQIQSVDVRRVAVAAP